MEKLAPSHTPSWIVRRMCASMRMKRWVISAISTWYFIEEIENWFFLRSHRAKKQIISELKVHARKFEITTSLKVVKYLAFGIVLPAVISRSPRLPQIAGNKKIYFLFPNCENEMQTIFSYVLFPILWVKNICHIERFHAWNCKLCHFRYKSISCIKMSSFRIWSEISSSENVPLHQFFTFGVLKMNWDTISIKSTTIFSLF